MNLHHRPATVDDFAALHRLYNLEREVNHQIGWDATDEAGFRAIFDEMIASGEQFVVCDGGREGGSDGGVIGAYRVHRFAHRMRHVAHIASVGLMGAHQGKGIGRRMMEGIIERLRGEGIKRIELTVAGDNPRAMRLYESLGFAREGVFPKYFLRAGEAEYKDEVAMGMWVGE